MCSKMYAQSTRNLQRDNAPKNRSIRHIGSAACIALASICTVAQASEDNPLSAELVSDISLEDLLNLNVSVASSRPESIPETPAVVSRYEAQDLKQMGLRNFKDFLRILPGVMVQDSYGTSVVSMRGIFEGFNQKVLFLVNGVPYFMPSHSDIPLLGVPFESISHIEVIRGPGAVYHGTNASAGVINVVTKDKGESTVSLSAGSNSLVNSSYYLSHSFNKDADVSLAYESQKTDGYKGEVRGATPNPFVPGLPTDADDIPLGAEMDSFLLKYRYKDTNIMVQAFESETKVLAGFASVVSHTIHEQEGYLFHLDHNWTLEKTAIKVYADYNQYSLKLPVERQGPGGIDGGFRFDDDNGNFRRRIGTSVNHRILDDLDFYIAIESENRSIDNYEVFNGGTGATLLTIVEEDSVIENSLASQFDYTLGDWRFLIGGRYTKNAVSGEQFTPRASSVFNIDDKQSLKLLYSTGFNSPNFLQQKILVTGVIEGNPDLEAETVRTTDLVYTYYTTNTLFSANAFYLEARDFIERIATTSGINFSNAGNFNRYGVELDYQYSVYRWKTFTNLGYLKQGDRNIAKDSSALLSPKITAAFGTSFQVNSNHGLGTSLRVIGKRNGLSSQRIVNFDYRYSYENFELNLTLRNATDEKVINTDFTNLRTDAYLQGEDGRNVLVGIKYDF